MRPPFKQRHPLLLPLGGMTITILLLFLLSYFFTITSSNKLNLNAAVIRITATQRALSQQVINSLAADNLGSQVPGPPLDSVLYSFNQLQHLLLYGDKNLNIEPLKEELIPEFNKLNVDYTDLLQQAEHSISNNSNGNFINLLNAENRYLQQLDSFTNSVTVLSGEEIKNFQLEEICILFISIAIIFMEIKFIFLPAIRKIEKQNTVLREISFTQSHTIRRPLTNIQSLLNLVLEIKKQDTFSIELLTLAKKEAEELDAVIRNNVQKSDKSYKVNA